MEVLRQMGERTQQQQNYNYLTLFRLFGTLVFFQSLSVGLCRSFVCVSSLSCVIAALLCLCRGSVDMRKKGRIAKPPTVT